MSTKYNLTVNIEQGNFQGPYEIIRTDLTLRQAYVASVGGGSYRSGYRELVSDETGRIVGSDELGQLLIRNYEASELYQGARSPLEMFHGLLYDPLIEKHRRGLGIHLLNTTIIPSTAGYSHWAVLPINATVAQDLLIAQLGEFNEGCWLLCGREQVIQSHLGHQGTVDFAKAELPQVAGSIHLDRKPWDGGGLGLVCQINGRLQEGQILTEEDMRAIGCSWRLLYSIR